jgi:serine/threonine protein phosphatase 1
MASWAIGDVHGNARALDDLLRQLEREISSGDTVVFLGDYIDRGPDTCRCIDRILEFRAGSSATVITLMGNHEDWLLKTMRDYTRHAWILVMDAFPTIQSYSPEAARELRSAVKEAGRRLYEGDVLPYQVFFDAIPSRHLEFFQGLKLFYQTSDAIFAHAGIDPRVRELERQHSMSLLMGTLGFVDGHEGPDVVVYGHLNNATLDGEGWPQPRVLRWTIGIDTISHGVLTAIRLPDRAIFQSSRYRGGRD